MQAKLRTGINPLAYLGVDPITPPMLKLEDRDPTNNDFAEYEVGAIWLVSSPTKIWMMVNKDPNPAITKWVQIYPGDGSGTNFFPTDSGTAVQVGGTLNIFGSNDVATMATGNTVTVALENDVTIVNSLTLTPILNKVLATDGTGLIYGLGGTNKQIMVWSVPDGDVPGFHSVTSDDGTVNFEWSALTPGAISITAIGGGGGGFGGLIADDTNTAVPALNKITLAGDGVNLTTTASGSTLTVSMGDIITLLQTNPGATQGIIKLGTERFITNLGTDNTFVGQESGNYTLTTGSSTGNTALGTGVLNELTTSPNNTGIGVGSLTEVKGGSGSNTAVGALSGASLEDGHNNLLLGESAGINYTSENHNISLSNDGVALDDGVIRIGNTTDHNHCYVQGIYGKTGGATNGVVSADTDGKLFSSNGTNGQVLIGGGTGPVWATLTSSDASIIFTPGANQLDMVAVGGGGSSGITKLGADTGTPALPLLGEVDIYGGTNINTITGPNSVVVNLDEWISLPATNAAGTAGGISLNSIRFMHAIGTNNTFLGSGAGNMSLSTTYADESVGIGTNALSSISKASENTAVGFEALKSAYATVANASSKNTAIGWKALTALNNNTFGASNNVAVGYSAGSSVTTGDENVILGSGSGNTLTTGDNNILIGYNIEPTTATTSDECRIGNINHDYYLPGLRVGSTVSSIYNMVTANYTTGKLSILQPSTTSYDVLSISPITGAMTWLNIGTKYAFHAVQASDALNVTGDGTTYLLGTSAIFSEIYDYGNNFYPGGAGNKALFTAPKSGLYQFICTVLATGLPVGGTTRRDPIYIYTSNRTYQLINPVINYTTTTGEQTITFTAVADMDVSDTAYFGFGLQTNVGTKTIGIGATYTTLSGFFVS